MLTKSEAEDLVQKELRKMETREYPFDIVRSATIDKPYAWIFFYNTIKHLETNIIIYALAGNGPIFVNKKTSEVIAYGTNKPLEQLINEYERKFG